MDGNDIPAAGKVGAAGVAWAAARGVLVAPALIGVGVGVWPGGEVGVGVDVTVGVAVGVAVEVGVAVAPGVSVGVAVGVGVGVGVWPNVKERAVQALGVPCALGLEVGAVGATASFLNW